MNLEKELLASAALVAILTSLSFTGTALAHQSGCHRWHTCPSDTGSYEMDYTRSTGSNENSASPATLDPITACHAKLGYNADLKDGKCSCREGYRSIETNCEYINPATTRGDGQRAKIQRKAQNSKMQSKSSISSTGKKIEKYMAKKADPSPAPVLRLAIKVGSPATLRSHRRASLGL